MDPAIGRPFGRWSKIFQRRFLSPHGIHPGSGLASTPHRTEFYLSSLKTQCSISLITHLKLSSKPSQINEIRLPQIRIPPHPSLSDPNTTTSTSRHSTHSQTLNTQPKSKSPLDGSDLKRKVMKNINKCKSKRQGWNERATSCPPIKIPNKKQKRPTRKFG